MRASRGISLVLFLVGIAGCSGGPDTGEDCAQIDRFVDADGDGYGIGEAQPVCPDVEGFADAAGDCDDGDPGIGPGAEEQCNGLDDDCNGTADDDIDVVEICNGGIDDDCNGLFDDGDPGTDRSSMTRWYLDNDGDGYGDESEDFPRCLALQGYIEDGTDCNDNRADVSPASQEVCNGVDDDCDNQSDDADPSVDPATQSPFYADLDSDGYGDRDSEILACAAVPGLSSANPNDCDDTAGQINPGRSEQLCDTLDNDCNAGTTDDRDADADTVSICDGDCDDTNPATSPLDPELPGDGVDSNCNLLEACWLDTDEDGARTDTSSEISDRTCSATPGFAPTEAPIDCDDTDPGVDVVVGWYEDPDGDGYGSGNPEAVQCLNPGGGLVRETEFLDCDEGDAAHSPGTPEICDDGIDQNCNDAIDCDDRDCIGTADCLAPCADAALPSAVPVVANGDTLTSGDDTIPSCNVGSTANDVAYEWNPPADGLYTIDLAGSNYDTMLYVLDGCGGIELACNDDSAALGLQSEVQIQAVAGQPVIIIVDGFGAVNGNYTLNIN